MKPLALMPEPQSSNNFISHYVQMKPRRQEPSRNWMALYIPLRSDETPDVFQHTMRLSDFISHYVQMKLPCADESDAAPPALYPTTFRWNPFLLFWKNGTKLIYIPLRSDEINWRTSPRAQRDEFISHYVQMKLGAMKESCRHETHLYPTTFRWNIFMTGQPFPLSWDLYPTTFRWNEPVPIDHTQIGRIYIPLRSDETDVVTQDPQCCLVFISHYVQMKQVMEIAKEIGHVIYIPLRSDETRGFTVPYNRLFAFISHYVQMKPWYSCFPCGSEADLYPTTFRWNGFRPCTTMSSKAL